jgi:hypothetical protein
MILGQDKICVFISYSHQDRQICEQIAGYMAAQKYLEGYRYGSQECKAGYLRCKSLTEAQEK